MAVCLTVLLIGGLIWGGNYPVPFAIGRSSGLQDIAPESTLSKETTQGIIQTWQRQTQQAGDWMENAAVEGVQVQSAGGLKRSGEAAITDPARSSGLRRQRRLHRYGLAGPQGYAAMDRLDH